MCGREADECNLTDELDEPSSLSLPLPDSASAAAVGFEFFFERGALDVVVFGAAAGVVADG